MSNQTRYTLSGSVSVDADENLYSPIVYYSDIVGYEKTWEFQGSNFGYVSGGAGPAGTGNGIERFPFASSTTNSTDIGDLTVARKFSAGQSSPTHGYTSGGATTPTVNSNVIDRFSFSATATTATDVGDLVVARHAVFGNHTEIYGYASGGEILSPSPTFNSSIERFPFASATGNSANVGSLTGNRAWGDGNNSSTHGYTSGGYTGEISKFPFASDTPTSEYSGGLVNDPGACAAQSSTTHGYISGGFNASTPAADYTNIINKFLFASGTQNATDIADLVGNPYGSAGHSSTTHGYSAGGSSPSYTHKIERFPFASDVNASSVGDLITDTSKYNENVGQHF